MSLRNLLIAGNGMSVQITVIIAVIVLLLGGYVGHRLGSASGERVVSKMRAEVMAATAQHERDTEALQIANEGIERLKAASEQREQQLVEAMARNTQRQAKAVERVKYIERYVPTGATECERTSDAITEALRK